MHALHDKSSLSVPRFHFKFFQIIDQNFRAHCLHCLVRPFSWRHRFSKSSLRFRIWSFSTFCWFFLNFQRFFRLFPRFRSSIDFIKVLNTIIESIRSCSRSHIRSWKPLILDWKYPIFSSKFAILDHGPKFRVDYTIFWALCIRAFDILIVFQDTRIVYISGSRIFSQMIVKFSSKGHIFSMQGSYGTVDRYYL